MRKFGLLGKKLSHSLSPLLHSIFFEEMGIEAEYKLYEVAEHEIDNFKNYMFENSIEGVNITVPYKKAFLDKLDFISDEAKEIGAINLLYIKENKFYGDNTDYYGFKQTLLTNQIEPSGKKMAIIGRGGASASVYKVLKDMGAEDIAFYFRKDKLSKIEFPEDMTGDIIINTTPVGMYPNIEDNIVDEQILKKFNIAIDLIYNPLETKFLEIARKNGLKTVNGMEMLIGQALKTDEILYDLVLSNQLREKIIKKIIKRVKEFYENNGN
ncbi:shikimate dehydrogenase [uncultured Fusobacterium sp.]|uniref:shikimate dehydrogenase family protein n=1 Tax=uncultured Fusobacterium sp. TaxID=159267 RepID=UPI002611BCD2|nr:shikimate dehydrogenase [uncultured Fusobacterium sp.]